MKALFKMVCIILIVLVSVPVLYLLISFLLTIIPVAEKESKHPKPYTIYIATNGVHADIVLPKNLISNPLLKDLINNPKDTYIAFGWGEENFYINTPTWGDLTFSNAFKAAFLKSKTLMHVTRYKELKASWVPILVTKEQLDAFNTYILQTFDRSSGEKTLVDGVTYTPNQDNFYRAHGNYMYYRTCNSWLNKGLKESGMKGSLWTPFDFGVTRWYK